MKPHRIAAALLMGLTLTPAMADAQQWGRPGNQAPVRMGTCSLARTCPPGVSIDVIQFATKPRNVGTLRLQVVPEHAVVWVDGVYAGRAADFDGVSLRSELSTGTHRIELRAEGYEQTTFTTRIDKQRTSVNRAALTAIATSAINLGTLGLGN